MDPVSVAASLLTLLGAAGATCEFVYNFILDIADIPDEIRSQAIKLQCLHQSISTLLDIYRRDDLPPELQIDPFLERNIRIFLDDVRKVETKIQSSSKRLDGSRTCRLWERLTWLSSDRRLRKFYGSLDDWIKIFSTTVSTTNLELTMKVHKQTATAQSSPPAICPEHPIHSNKLQLNGRDTYNGFPVLHQVEAHANKQRILSTKFAVSAQETVIPKALGVYLSQRFDPIGLKVKRWGIMSLRKWSADLRVGPVVVRCWSEKGKPVYKIVSWRKGICLSSTFRDHKLFSRRITLMISGIIQAPKISINCNMNICSMLQITSSAYSACQKGDWPLLRRLLENSKVKISDSTGYGDTLLHIAARLNHYHLVSGLLQEGAKVDAENDFGETPLQAAVKRNCSYDVARCLLSFGADLNHPDVTGRTPLHVFFNESVRSILEFHQEDVDNTMQDSRGMTIAQYVSWSKSSLPIDLFRCCRGNISSLDIMDKEGRTALHFACQRGNLELLECFLNERNALISRPDWHGRTLMHYATESGRSPQAIDILSRQGFDLRAIDHKGRTVLHQAASGRSVAAVDKLIELGAAEDLNALDDDSRTPLQVAALCGRVKTVELLQPLCDDAQVSILTSDQKAMGGHGRDSNSSIGSHFNTLVCALLGVGLLAACLFFRFVH